MEVLAGNRRSEDRFCGISSQESTGHQDDLGCTIGGVGARPACLR